jgi:toxin-antitoxin system PIN domain toxin
MMLPDINVLVAAHRVDHPLHKVATDWLARTLKDSNNGQVLVMPMLVISGFLRLVTNAKIFPVPSSRTRAVDFVDWLLEDAHVRLLGNTSEWVVFRRLILDKRLAANHIPDAHLAALSLSFSEPLVTFDKGFRQLLPRSLLVLLVGN